MSFGKVICGNILSMSVRFLLKLISMCRQEFTVVSELCT